MFNCDFRYTLRYNVKEEYDCENSGCNSEGICRCRRITGISFTDPVNSYEIMESIGGLNYLPPIDLYVIDRFIRYKFIEDAFGFTAEWDYYGQELSSIYLLNRYDLEQELNSVLCMSEIDKIKYVLELEYGFITSSIKDITVATVESVKPSDIVIQNMKHFDNCILNSWATPENIPVCVCKFDGEKFTLIDGYHRLKTLLLRSKKLDSFLIVAVC